MIKRVTTILVGLMALGGAAMATPQDGQFFYAEDNAPAIRVYNSGSELVKIFINSGGASATNSVTIGDTVNTIDGSGDTDTVAEFAAAIAACTNSSGKKVLTVDTGCAVATTESTDGELLDELGSVNQIQPGNWGRVAWDTSDVKHFRTYIPSGAKDKGPSRGGLTINKLYGNAGGTGDLALKGYIDGTKVFDRAVESPVYSTVDGTVINTNSTLAGTIEIDVEIYVGAKQRFVLSADRATTATTGGAGVEVDYK